jgi:hypothetical protein
LTTGTKVIGIIFIWITGLLAVGSLTRHTKFDWLTSGFLYTSFVLMFVLRTSESSRRERAIKVEEARPTFRRVMVIFISIGVWLGSMFGVLTLLPKIDSFHLWMVWGVILILWSWILEKIWKKIDTAKHVSWYGR